MLWAKNKQGFTIVELLIVVVVIAVIAAITIVSYNGIASQARETAILAELRNIHKMIESYNAQHGHYPITSPSVTLSGVSSPTVPTYTDAGCPVGDARADWVPGLDTALPQSDNNATRRGASGLRGCYMYTSDGSTFVLSAWNLLSSPQKGTPLYKRVGFREMSLLPYYYCNHPHIGGNDPLPYLATRDYYKYSLTITNVTFCNETPPSGA